MQKISVVTVCRDSESFINTTIESVISQNGIGVNYTLEHVFVYAESSDKTLEIITKYKEKYPHIVKIIYESKAEGISSAMNLGITSSSGDIINHLHSDDYYSHDNVLNKVIEIFDRNPESKWLYSHLKVIEHSGELHSFRESKLFYYLELYNRSLVPHPTVFIKRELFEEYNMFDTSYKCTMDYDLWFRIGKDNIPVIVDDYFVCFRGGEGSTSNRFSELTGQEAQHVRMKYQNDINERIDLISSLEQFKGNRIYFSSVFYRISQLLNKVEVNDKRRAIKCLLISIRLNPFILKRYLYIWFQ